MNFLTQEQRKNQNKGRKSDFQIQAHQLKVVGEVEIMIDEV